MSSLLRGEPDINSSVRKATTPEELAPKRKHVRACVVYTWDHREGRSFWNAIKLLPIQNDEVQCFKALVTIHKVMQEGHKSVIKEGFNNTSWLLSLARSARGGQSYGRLIEEYVRLIVHKLEFHRTHPAFNGTFEYEEYISLRSVDDPNEGYESIIDLMNLQDSIDDFQRLVFSSLRGKMGNECRISSLTAMVAESYGIYCFATSMLRAMHTSSDSEVLEPLRSRYHSQHRRLRNFYFDCTTLKHLTSLITIPELTEESPNLLVDDEAAPKLPKRPMDRMKTGDTSRAPSIAPEPTGDWYMQQQNQQNQLQQQNQYEEQQRLLQQQQEAEQARQHLAAMEQQRAFDAQQQALLAQQQQAQEQFMRQQQQTHAEGRAAELERELFMLRNQQEEAQMILQQYDQRVQTLETELSQGNELTQRQIASKTEQVESLTQQASLWKSKYESLAKLYSQLRQEHLELLAKFKKVQAKAASAQESIEKRESLERELKSRHLDLADMIRERDRARHELDNFRGQHRTETEKLEREVLLLSDKLSGNSLSGGASAKDEEIEYLKETVAVMESELRASASGANNDSLLDTVLNSAAESIQEALFLFETPIGPGGNQSSNSAFVASIADKAWDCVDNFSNAFTDAIAEGETADQGPIIRSCLALSSVITELLAQAKGLSQSTQKDGGDLESITGPSLAAATGVYTFFTSMISEILHGLDLDEKIDLVVANHTDVQEALQQLSEALHTIMPKSHNDVDPNNAMASAAAAADRASQRLAELMSRPRDPSLSAFDRQVHEAILSAAVAVASAIAVLIKAATEVQQEIVARGKGTESSAVFYKKNHRWTQGLITAAYAVSDATNVLISTADGTITGGNSPEELIVASNEVSASTAQLVAAARVKSEYASKTQDGLERASKSVTAACKALVAQVQDIISKKDTGTMKETDYTKLSDHEFKSAAMEQQVEVLKLERALNAARNRLFEIRRMEYARQENELE